MPCSKQSELPARLWRAEQSAVEFEAHLLETRALPRQAEPGPEEVRPDARRAHASEELGIVVATTADRSHDAHHLVATLREMGREPLAEQWGDFVREPQRDPADRRHAERSGAGDDLLHEFVGDR